MTRYEIENKRIILRIKRGLDLRQTLMELAKREVRIHPRKEVQENTSYKGFSHG